ncbi:sugar ABC transporter substrate-binding protein [Kaistia sp. 32K]|uniref:polysaccharide biosynthesis/export family protein n=1 Tax=Kaistia sp. 32K TaxID=2795690 RepID=UPI001914F9DA|nr:polysaccharide biosynthesis/export family protein [Kaistia sp. 32K]BCP52430.1 sugar ABC transporter substrate-binding protein [Kaistia sp. 32K]
MRAMQIAALVLIGWIGWGGPAIAADAGANGYRLGPQDRLRVKVYDWRTGSAEMHEWTALTGEFVVDAAGNVSLPLVGEVPAADQTTSQLAQSLADRLKDRAGLAQRPDASIEVVNYRPFYMIGQVVKPGEYGYRPGMTVLQAVSIAGGLVRPQEANMLDYERDALTQRGELRVLATEQQALIARQARLDAELHGADSIAFPKALLAQETTPEVARAMREEQLLFETGRSALQSQTESLGQAKILLQHEVETLSAKEASVSRQLALSKKELDQVNGLVAKGLAVMPRQLQTEQNTSQFESNLLDIQLSSLRAQQDIARIDRDLSDFRDKQRSQFLAEAREVRTSLDAVNERIATTQTLIYQSEVRSPQVTAQQSVNARRAPVYSITRRVNGVFRTETTSESDLVEPGDTVHVDKPPELQRPDARG